LLHRFRRPALVALLCLGLTLPAAVSGAGPKDRLKATESGLSALRARIQRNSQRARSLKLRIAVLGERITSAQIAINELDADIVRARSAVMGARRRVEALQAGIDELNNLAVEQAVMLYKAGATDSLTALLDSHSIAELGSRIDLLGVAAQENTGALVRYGRLRAAVEAENRVLFAQQRRLDRSRAAQAVVLARRAGLKDDLARELERLNARLGVDKTREGHLESEARSLKQKILEAQARHSVEVLGTSRRGFVWPLNGPVTSPFGERWGGMHTGIDIDGYTGQPVVAVKEGRVIYLGAGMTGYGNTVIIDHGGGISTLYAHLSGYGVAGGAAVTQGEVIGYVGCTGNCYGDHLHFEVRTNGNPVDPMAYLP
jgi:murein DD-endopeptidase MepM/ murein hydrolase activator NlpD